MALDPSQPPIPQPVADPAAVLAVLNALRQRVENLTTVVISLQAQVAAK